MVKFRMYLDMGYKERGEVKDDFQIFALSNWVSGMALTKRKNAQGREDLMGGRIVGSLDMMGVTYLTVT